MKKVLCSLLISGLGILVVGCGNQQLLDTQYTYNKAIIGFPDGSVKEVEVKKWNDYDDDTSIQIISEEGEVYLTDLKNVVLLKEGK